MSAAVDVSVLVEVDEVDEQLNTNDTDETRRMPTHVTARSTSKHRQLALAHRLTALREENHRHTCYDYTI